MGALLGRPRQTRGHVFPEPIIPPFPGTNIYGQVGSGTPDSALMVPTVWACVMLLANAVSMLPLQTYRRTDGVPARAADPQLITSPAPGMTQSEWLHMLMVSLLLRGNAYGRIIERDRLQRPTQIALLNPDAVRVRVADDGTKTFTLSAGHKTVTLGVDDVWQVRGLTLPGSQVGLSPISYAAATLGVDLSSRQFASDYFAGGGIPKAVLTSDQKITHEQARTLKERLLSATRQREPVVLGNGTTYSAIQVKPEESQFLATQQANVAQVARYFGVPPEMVGGSGGNSMTYANVEQRQIDFLTMGVQFWLKRIEDSVFPLLPAPTYAAFNTDVLLRTDAETQAKVDVQLIAGKVLTPTEVRARRNIAPMTDEQKAEADMVPLTVTPNGGAKALPALKEPPGPPAPVPPAEEQGATSAA